MLMVPFAVQKLLSLLKSYVFIFCFCFWCQIQKIIANTDIKELTDYIFLEFYDFGSYGQVFNPF